MRLRLPPRLKRFIRELIAEEEGRRGRGTITKREGHTTYVTDTDVDTPSLKIGGVEVIDSSRNIKNVVDAYIGGKINNIPIGLNVGGIIGFWYDLRAESRNLAKGRLVEITIHSVIDFTNYNPQGIPDYYGCRIVGFVSPRYSETYTFYVTSDDGVRVWFNGRLVVDAWKDQGATTYSWTADLTAGRWYPIVIEHYEHGGTERLCLEWESASQAREVVPSDRLAYSTIDLITALKAIHGDLSIVSGKLLFGNYPSGSKFDVCLYRSAADVLKTDDDFDARSLRIGGTEVIDSSRNIKNVVDVLLSGLLRGHPIPIAWDETEKSVTGTSETNVKMHRVVVKKGYGLAPDKLSVVVELKVDGGTGYLKVKDGATVLLEFSTTSTSYVVLAAKTSSLGWGDGEVHPIYVSLYNSDAGYTTFNRLYECHVIQ